MRGCVVGGSGGAARIRVGGSPRSFIRAELCMMSSRVAEASAVAVAASRSLRLMGASMICKERRLQFEARQQFLHKST